VKFLFRPTATNGAGLLSLPWDRPLEEWPDDVVLESPQRGVSRHVVRFVATEGQVFALKEIAEPLARHEYALLGEFEAEGLPAVSAFGVCVDRPGDLPAVLVTEYLDYSVSYRHLFSGRRGEYSPGQLVATMAELLVRLHLAGVFWGDCSLSNTLFRPDAGTMAAYLVDAETVERHPTLTPGQRSYDVDLATERVAAELMDLECGGLLPDDIDPIGTALGVRTAYEALWVELTGEELIDLEAQREGLADRLRRLGDLGFDADEVELVTSPEGVRLRVRTSVAEPGHHRHELARLTGLEVQENQARCLLGDLGGYHAWLERQDGRTVAGTVAGRRWLAEIYAPVVESIPDELVGRLEPAEVFYEILVHRGFLSETRGADIGTIQAADSYYRTVLPLTPPEITSRSAMVSLTAT
jgi:hypothetical protein